MAEQGRFRSTLSTLPCANWHFLPYRQVPISIQFLHISVLYFVWSIPHSAMISLGVFPLHAFLRSRAFIVTRFFEFFFSFLTESSSKSCYSFGLDWGKGATGIAKAGASTLSCSGGPLKVKDLERSNLGINVVFICRFDCCLCCYAIVWK